MRLQPGLGGTWICQDKETAVIAVGLRWYLQVVDCSAWGTVRCKLEQVGSTRGACPKVYEFLVERWVLLVEGVQVENVMVIGFAQRDGESPVQVVVIVEEEYCFSPV